MNEDNKKFLDINDFKNRILNVMECKGFTIDDIYNKMTEDIGYNITKNNLNIYLQRVPSVYFLIALSKALGVSTDYLLGLEDINYYSSGFDYHYDDKKYTKYIGEYYFYFYPTVSNTPEKINVAKLTIDKNNLYESKLVIETDEGDKKAYVGKLILSNTYNIGYITLKGINLGEMVFLSFCDPIINSDVVKTETVLGSMLSISSGDFKRVPVMSRFFISRKSISKIDENIIKSNLLLNTKYINIGIESLSKSLNDLGLEKRMAEEILNRLTAAFCEKKYYRIEESFILNTLKNDYHLSTKQAENIISVFRINSINSANIKINKSSDARIFSYLNKK